MGTLYKCYFCYVKYKDRCNLMEHLYAKHTMEKGCKCLHCPLTFPGHAGRTRHIQKCHNLNPRPIVKVKCPQCPAQFKHKADCTTHIKYTHGLGDVFPCTKCRNKFPSKKRLISHFLTHETNRKKLKCSICDKEYYGNSNLQRHIKQTHTKHTDFPCYFCPKKYKDKSYLYDHLPTHTKERLESDYNCSFCPVVCNTRQSFRFHIMRKHTHERPYKCNVCGNSFPSRSGLSDHERMHSDLKPFKCLKCPSTFKFRQSLRYHVRFFHDKIKDFSCDECGKTFFTITGKKTHLLSVHSAKKGFPCTVCNKPFATKRYLSNHMKRHTSMKQFECYFCPKTFQSLKETNLFNHLLIHTREKPYKCTWNVGTETEVRTCTFGSIHHSVLQHHIKVEHESQRVYCPFCKTPFKSKGSLRVHLVAIHTLEKPYTCEDCGKQFHEKGRMISHRKWKHIHRLTFPCPLCGRILKTQQGYNNHVPMCGLCKGKSWECYFCGRKYRSLIMMNDHLRSHTLEKPFKCSDCYIAFPFSYMITAHNKKNHSQKTEV